MRTLTAKVGQPAGSYTIAVHYFDMRTGASPYEFLLNEKAVASWIAGRHSAARNNRQKSRWEHKHTLHNRQARSQAR